MDSALIDDDGGLDGTSMTITGFRLPELLSSVFGVVGFNFRFVNVSTEASLCAITFMSTDGFVTQLLLKF